MRSVWLQLTGSPQQYAAYFETLSQLALAMAARRALGATTWRFALPSASDNTAAEARTEKLWSTAEPLGAFLKVAAGWAAPRHIEFLVTHHAGEYNQWADELSRRELGCVSASACRCMAFWTSQGAPHRTPQAPHGRRTHW